MSLNKESLSQHLHTPYHYYTSVDSTNDIARAWLLDGASDGAVVIADEQRKGRGRMGRNWYTPPGVALALSVVLRPPMHSLSLMSMLGAVAIAELCDSVGAFNVTIKWPNDVLIQGKKVSGVLPEAIWQENRLAGVVLGMGVNVKVEFDDVLRETAINLSTVVSELPTRPELIARLLKRVHFWSNTLVAEDNVNGKLYQAWLNRLTTIGRQVLIADMAGVVDTIDVDGALILIDSSGQKHRIIAGELRYITEKIED